LVLGEALVRVPAFQAHVVANKKGGRHRQFELQLGRLETAVARDGPIDCIILGNSMVWYGFDPQAFAQAYQRQTGREIRCFNLGVDGLPAVGAGALAPILAADYKPSLLIYGTSARDYVVSQESYYARSLLEMAWLQYRLGQFSIRGWFYDHSRLYQYSETLGHLIRFEKRYLLLIEPTASFNNRYGFYGNNRETKSVDRTPDPQSPEREVQGLFEQLSDYRMLPENLTGLEQVMAQNSRGTQVLIVEMPVPPTYLHFFGNGKQDYQRFIDQVDTVVASRAIRFWPTTQLLLIPDDGWTDYSHLNVRGGQVFSRWLGEKVGSAVVQGKLRSPVADR